MQLLEMLGAGILGAVSVFVSNRVRFRDLERDVKELSNKVDESVTRIELLFRDGRDTAAVKDQREANDTKAALNSIRQANEAHHAENSQRLAIMREQIFVLGRLMMQMARATPGMNPSDVDEAMSRVLALELKRAD